MPTTTGLATSYIQFTRTSNATVTDSDGKIKWAGHNLLTNSESFDASAWTKTLTTVTANAIAAPNGTLTADKIEATANGAALHQDATGTGDTVTFSAYFKKGNIATSVNSLLIRNQTTATNLLAARVNLDTGAITYLAGSSGATAEDVGNGWWKLTLTTPFTAGNTVRASVFGGYGSANGEFSYVWGAHLYRSDLGGMVLNPARGDAYYPTTPRNRLGFTEDFSNAVWVKNSTTVATNTEISPNGLQTADTLTASAGTGVIPRVADTASATTFTNTVYTASIYAKPGTYQFLQIYINSQATEWANYTLSGSGSASANGSATASITSVGNGWYRLSITYTAGGTDRLPLFMLAASASATRAQSWNPVGTETIYLWGAQFSDSASLDAYSPVYGAAVTSAAYYAPRLDYSGSSLAALGLLVEEQRTNEAIYSQVLNSLFNYSENANFTVTTGVAPDGTATATSLVATAGTVAPLRARLSVTFSATTYTLSIYAKSFGYNFLSLAFYDGSASHLSYFNLSNGTVGTNASGNTASITPVGNGWYRCAITRTLPATSSGQIRIFPTNADNTTTYTADGTSGIYVYGAQLEAGSFATSYIPTGASQATRNADVASVSTQAFPYSATEGTIVAAYQLLANTGTLKRVFDLYDTTKGVYENIIAVNGVNPASTTIFAEVVNGSSSQASFNLGTPSVGVNKSALAFKANDFNAAHNGVVGTTDTTGTVPTANTLRIGAHADSTVLNGWLRQITYIPRRLSNSELQARTV